MPADLLPSERYITMNRFRVRQGADAKFEQRWAERDSALLDFDGFRWFGLLQRVPPSGEGADYQYPDDVSYVSFTTWDTKDQYDTWRSGPAFKEAHGGGSLFSFIGRMVTGFFVAKGPPKPAFWHSVLVEKAADESSRPEEVAPGSLAVADGQRVMQPEVFVAMNRFTVTPGREADFEQRWAARDSQLRELPGFRFFQMLRREAKPDDDVNYISMSVWDNRAAFDSWRSGDSFKQAHGGGQAEGAAAPPPQQQRGPMGGMLVRPPRPYFYEGKMVLESPTGA